MMKGLFRRMTGLMLVFVMLFALSARVMAVADVFDALTSRRVYKPAFPIEKAVDILREGAGTQFDPKCVEVFLDSIELARSAMLKYQDEAGQEGR